MKTWCSTYSGQRCRLKGGMPGNRCWRSPCLVPTLLHRCRPQTPGGRQGSLQTEHCGPLSLPPLPSEKGVYHQLPIRKGSFAQRCPFGDYCVFITAVPITKLFALGEGDRGGHVLRETTSQGLCGLVCPSRTSERGGEGDCVKGGEGEEGERERERALGLLVCHSP